MSKFAAYEKVIKCIKSSETNRHWIGSLKMIQLHYKMYKDDFLNRLMRDEHEKWLKNKVKENDTKRKSAGSNEQDAGNALREIRKQKL